ncbi:MAG: exopolyphosphatase [Acidimicrobiales bacterium]|nr:exopolyphosphatase [Acidimicrobiales bacterium]
MPATLAAVDVGTNSLHLVVARVTEGDRFEVIAREKEMVRLGSGSGDMKVLSADAMDRGVAALARFRRIAEIDGAPVRAVATSAVREAENHDEFIRRAADEAGVSVEVISGVEEARLIHLGVLQALPVFDRRLLLCDIGGGSTELLIGERGDILAAASLKLGSVRLTNRFFAAHTLHPSAVDSCRRHVASVLASFDRAVTMHGYEVAIGSSGTIEQVLRLSRAAGGEEPLHTYNGATVAAGQVHDVVDALARARRKGGPIELPGLDPKRADIILAGALVLEGVVDRFGIDDVVLSEYALREGVLLDTMQRSRGGSLHHLRDVSRRGVVSLLRACDEDVAHSEHVARLALELFDATADLHGLAEIDPGARDYLEAGALLANVGLSVSHAKHHKHSYYLIRNSDRLVGLTDGEIEVIAQIARYHRKSGPRGRHPEYATLSPEAQQVVRTCAAILRVAIGLDRGHHERVKSVTATCGDGRLTVAAEPADPGDDLSLELYAAADRSGLLEEVLGLPVDVVAA